MARLPHGILGPVYGRIGNVVGTSWKGEPVVRTLPTGNPDPSYKQLEQRQRFGMMIYVMRNMQELLSETFKPYSGKMSAVNNAQQYNIKNAIIGIYPALDIHYPTMLVSRGDLPLVEATPAVSDSPNSISFSWRDNTGLGIAKADDHAILVAYSGDKHFCIYDLHGAMRSDGTAMLTTIHCSNKKMHTWIAFANAAGTEFSNSVYTGEVVVK
ncbi:MAG: DUF6266 family protein [Chitinophagaceae bacterium]